MVMVVFSPDAVCSEHGFEKAFLIFGHGSIYFGCRKGAIQELYISDVMREKHDQAGNICCSISLGWR